MQIVPLWNVTEICRRVSEIKHGSYEEWLCRRSPLQLSDVGLQQAGDTLPALVNDLQQKVCISSFLTNISRYAVKLDN